MTAETGFTPEIVVGRSEDGKDADPRFVKNDTAITDGTYTKIKGEFELETTTPYIFFQLGKNNDTNYPNVDSNVIYIKDIRLFEVEEGARQESNLSAVTPSVDTVGLEISNQAEQSEATVAYDAGEQAAKINITKYNTTGGTWAIVAKAPLTGATIETGKKYGIEVEMKAETEIKPVVIVSQSAEKDGEPRFFKNDVSVGNSGYTKIKGEFNDLASTAPHIFFELGKDVDSSTPDATTNVIYIKGIRLYEIEEGQATEKDLFTLQAGEVSSEPEDEDAAKVEITKAVDGAANVTVDDQDGETKIKIGTYNTSEGSWSIIATIPLKGVTVDTTKTYGYEIVISADNPFGNAEMHCGSKSQPDDGNKWYAADIGTIGAQDRTLYHTFKFEQAYSELALHLFLGKDPGANNATSNTIYIKSFRFFEVEGDEKTDKIEDKFILFGAASPDKTNEKYPISVYNQSDDVFDAAPTGTAYIENGKLVYLIHRGGTDGGHNKLQIGFWENSIGPLPANAYYVVSFTIKASVELDFNVTLHDMETGFDVAEGGLMIRRMDFDGKACHAGTTETTIELVSDAASLVAHEKCELLLEFGKFLGDNKDVKIEISDLVIGYRAVQA